MLPLRYSLRWRTASGLILMAVLALTMMPAVWLWPDRDQVVRLFDSFDKLAHAVVFAILAIWFAGQYRKASYWRIALGLLAFGVFIELCQRLVGYRTAEWLDVVADGVGIVIGLSVSLVGLGGWALRVETWLVDERA
jgi:VanZ family protein